MSHEVRTPMNGVVGTAELLSDSPLSDSQRIHVDALRGAASSLMAVLNRRGVGRWRVRSLQVVIPA